MEMSDSLLSLSLSLSVCVCASPDVLGGWIKSVTVVTDKLLVLIDVFVFF